SRSARSSTPRPEFVGWICASKDFRARTDRHPTEVADLHGKRLVICNETSRSRAWDEATVKDVTGGDRLTARRMREDFWSWDPTHKLVVWGNHKPPIRNVDDGIRRRLRLVPFNVRFEGDARDRDLEPKLLAEAPGILRKLVDGCLTWQRTGLPEAAAVCAATDGYLRDEDTLGQFLETECVFAPDAKATRKAIHDRYVKWSEERCEKPAPAKVLAQALRDHKPSAAERNVRTQEGPRKGWIGVRLMEDRERPEPTESADRTEALDGL
ncbi:MAG: DNA primase family protein, partial [Polyangiaceae bacterium]